MAVFFMPVLCVLVQNFTPMRMPISSKWHYNINILSFQSATLFHSNATLDKLGMTTAEAMTWLLSLLVR